METMTVEKNGFKSNVEAKNASDALHKLFKMHPDHSIFDEYRRSGIFVGFKINCNQKTSFVITNTEDELNRE